MGLYHFSGLMRAIWVAARQDDPYADWYLLQVQESIEQARTELDRMRQQTHECLQSVPGIEVTIGRSLSPLQVPLRFGTPYGYMGAYSIADFDQLGCAILTGQHVGLLARDDGERLLQGGARLIRRLFAISLGWKSLGITREDVQQNNQRVRKARGTMGEIPEDILTGTRRARVAPVIHRPFDAE